MRRASPALFALVVIAGCSVSGGGAAATAGGSAPPGATVTVVTVFDGDSMLVDTGTGEREVRLAGVNAPEQDECSGAEAHRWMTDAAGDEVTLVPVGNESDTDDFDRLLRDVWVGTRWLNLEAVADGHAMVIHTGRDGQDDLLAAGDTAWEGRLGMWGASVCGPAPDGVEISDLVADPEGPDDRSPAGEYVTVENRGDGTVPIGGWVVRDESTANRYEFREDEVLEPGTTITVFSGCGDEAPDERFWCAQSPVWSNGGDTALLLTAEGTVVDRLVYP
ncbi:MAG: lamin tail domain-containing protein [Acidimicrobiia bacterium]